MVSSSLTISGQACTGGVLTAQFTITNRGTAAITFQRLVAGGRLNNEQTGAGGYPDFSFVSGITLNAGASYSYTGTQTLTRTGSYSFFLAYHKTAGGWITSLSLEAGGTNTASTSVTGPCGGGTPNPMVSSRLTVSG